jgi:predicted amidohydrolase
VSAPPARLRVAACQILTVPSPEASAARVVEWIERAAAEGVEVLAFPEAALCGYASDPAAGATAASTACC